MGGKQVNQGWSLLAGSPPGLRGPQGSHRASGSLRLASGRHAHHDYIRAPSRKKGSKALRWRLGERASQTGDQGSPATADGFTLSLQTSPTQLVTHTEMAMGHFSERSLPPLHTHEGHKLWSNPLTEECPTRWARPGLLVQKAKHLSARLPGGWVGGATCTHPQEKADPPPCFPPPPVSSVPDCPIALLLLTRPAGRPHAALCCLNWALPPGSRILQPCSPGVGGSRDPWAPAPE